MKRIAPLVLAGLLGAGSLSAQTLSAGADIVSRYVWRGYDFGESMAVQPSLSLEAWGFEVGAWGSYSVSASGAGANEVDVGASYTLKISEEGMAVSAGITDYYFPSPGGLGFREAEAHNPELFATLLGPESRPFTLFGGVMLDADASVYVEAGVPVLMDAGVELDVHAGAVAGESAFYETEKAALVSVGVTARRSLRITESYAPPVSVSFIVNPDRKGRAFLVFTLGLVPAG